MRSKKTMEPKIDARRLWIRCGVFFLGMMFFLFLAAARAGSADYYSYSSPRDEWDFPEEDDGDMMSYDDHNLSMSMRRRFIGDNSPNRRKKASRVHDSVTIVINETTSGSLESANDLSRNSSNNMVLSSWLIPSLKNGFSLKQRGTASGDANASTPTLAYSSDRTHASDSTIDRGQSITSTLTGEVIEVLPNRYLVVEAKKTVAINGETQTLIITGAVNPDHMNSNSSVDATHIMDMNVRYYGSGPMTRMDKRGWASKIYDFINPF